MSAPLKQGGSQAESSPEISDKTVHVLEVRSYTYVGHSTHTFALVGAEVLEERMAANKRSASACLCPKYVRTNRRSRRFSRGFVLIASIAYCYYCLLLVPAWKASCFSSDSGNGGLDCVRAHDDTTTRSPWA